MVLIIPLSQAKPSLLKSRRLTAAIIALQLIRRVISTMMTALIFARDPFCECN